MENRIHDSFGAEKFPERDDGDGRNKTDRKAEFLKKFSYSTFRGSALNFFLILTFSIFFGEVLSKIVINVFPQLPIMTNEILDSILHLISVFLGLYFFVFLPLKSQYIKRTQAEELLRFSEAIYGNLVNRMPDGVYKSTHDGKFIEINPAMVKMLGYDSKEELLAIDIKSQLYFEPGDRESITLQEQMEEMGVYRLKKKDGSAVWVEDHGWYNLGENGKILTHEGIMRDITDRKRIEDLLQLSEERYRTMVDSIGEGIGFVNTNEQFEFANSAAEKIFGVGPGELVGIKLDQLLTLDQYNLIQKETEKRTQGENSIYEFEITRSDGEKRTVQISAFAKTDQYGHFLGTYGVFSDITERKQTEMGLRKLNLAIYNLQEAVFMTDTAGTINYINPEFTKMYGYTAEEVVGKVTPRILVSGNFKKEDIIALWKTLLNKQPLPKSNYLNKTKDGKLIHVEGSANPILDNKGDIIGFLGIQNDVTQRILTEEALRESQGRFKRLFEEAPLGIALIDSLTGQVFEVNPMFAKIAGRTIEEITNTNWMNITHPDDIQEDLDHMALLNAGKISGYQIEKRYIKNDGTSVWVSMTIAPIFVKDKEHPRHLAMIMEITERKRAEADIKLKNEELLNLNAEKDKFFSIIAHDLRSPFNSILGLSDHLVEQIQEKGYDDIKKYAEIIQQSSNKAFDLLMNLMEWSQSQTGRMEFNPEYIDLFDLIKDITLLLSGAIEQKSITVAKIVPSNVLVFADKKMVETIFRNLISNAIKFTYPEGKITITVYEKQNELLVSVSDNGVGIPKAHIEKLFRIDESYSTAGTKNEKGTGLGLILCKEFVEKHGGRIWVESEVGKGSTFYFTIPRKE